MNETSVAFQNRQKIINRKALSMTISECYAGITGATRHKARTKVLNLLKIALKNGRSELENRLNHGSNGTRFCAANAYLIDQIICLVYEAAVTYAYPGSRAIIGERIAVVAVGGYGRAQMLPHSDVDLLFLHPYKAEGWIEQVIEFVLYMLWDLGLKVGHASRSVDDCIRMARQDVTIKTSVLENRFVYGDKVLHDELSRRFHTYVLGDNSFVKAKLNERDARHQRLGNTRYLLEPNIKEGKGGLRDLQTLYWIARYTYGVGSVTELEAVGVLNCDEAKIFRKAERFLLTVRCHLHTVTNRAEERLTFDIQPQISARLGYMDRDGLMGVERFMKHYFLVTKDVGDLTRIICAAIEEKEKSGSLLQFPQRWIPRRVIGRFIADSGRLDFRDKSAIYDEPVSIIELFQVSQAEGMDIHPRALRFIHQNLKLVNATLRNDPEANSLFIDILTSQNDPGITLRRLNEAGVLGKFLPDFGRIVAQMQHDMYHTYTVDEHTIRAVTALHQIEHGRLVKIAPLASRIFKKISNRRVLYLSVLLHDIAKGRGGDHSVLGADVARRVCPRLGLDESETETVAWLVYHHLTMSMTATKRDIDDPKTVAQFVDVVQGLERLHLLAIITTADIIAVGPNTWNAWKSQLLTELFYRAEDVMSGGVGADTLDRRVQRKREALRELCAGWSPETLSDHIANLPAPYWLHHPIESLKFHADAMGRRLQTDATNWVEARHCRSMGMTEIFVVGPDQSGFFSLVAGAISLGRVSIVEAHVNATRNGLAVETFAVQDLLSGDILDDQERLNRLFERIYSVLDGTLDLPSATAIRSHTIPKRSDAIIVHPQVYVDLDASSSHTVIEVSGRDRPGLLYELTQIMVKHKLSIRTSRIGTFGQRVVDVFYVRDQYGLAITHPDKLQSIVNDFYAVLRHLEDGSAMGQPGPFRERSRRVEDRGHLRHKLGTTPDATTAFATDALLIDH